MFKLSFCKSRVFYFCILQVIALSKRRGGQEKREAEREKKEKAKEKRTRSWKGKGMNRRKREREGRRI